MSNQLDYDRIRQNVDRELTRANRRSKWGMFFGHLFMAVIFTVVIWGVALTDPAFAALMQDKESPVMVLLLLPTILAFVGVIFHGITAFAETGLVNRAARDRAVLNGIKDEFMRVGFDLDKKEKPKRQSAVSLSDDGELIDNEPMQQQGKAL